MIIHCIYKTTNLINNKTYVGQFNGDEKKFKYYLGSGKKLKPALKKYGRKNFKKEIIVQGEFNAHLMDSLEIHYIQLYSPPESPLSYNIDRGGNNGRLGIPDPHRKKIFQYTLNGEFVKEWESATIIEKEIGLTARSIRGCASGKPLTNKGFIWLFDKNIKERTSKININYRKYSKNKIYQLDVNKNLIAVWDSLSDISKNTNFKAANINYALSGRGYTAYGFIWTNDLENVKSLSKREFARQRNETYSKYEDIFIYKDDEWYKFDTLKEVSVFLNNISLNVIRRRLRNGYFWTRIGILYSTVKFDILPPKPLSRHNKRVNQFDTNNNFIKSWNSIKDICLEYNISTGYMTKTLTTNKITKGFIWKYA